MEQWIFYTDLFGGFQWSSYGPNGTMLKQSTLSFDTALGCVQDAVRHGLDAEAAQACRVPGVVRVRSMPAVRDPQR